MFTYPYTDLHCPLASDMQPPPFWLQMSSGRMSHPAHLIPLLSPHALRHLTPLGAFNLCWIPAVPRLFGLPSPERCPVGSRRFCKVCCCQLSAKCLATDLVLHSWPRRETLGNCWLWWCCVYFHKEHRESVPRWPGGIQRGKFHGLNLQVPSVSTPTQKLCLSGLAVCPFAPLTEGLLQLPGSGLVCPSILKFMPQ